MAQNEFGYYHEISLTISSPDVEPVSDYIIENICGSLLLEDEDEDSRTTIRFYVADQVDVDSRVAGLSRYLAEINSNYESINLRRKRIKDLDWIEAYKKSVVPVLIGNSIVVKPPWDTETYSGRLEVLIEPKMAFGTGCHETTRGSLAMLEKVDLSSKTVLDLGCGSGVLSIYAAKRGAANVVGYDIDPLAIENSTENFAINEVEAKCRAYLGSLDDVPGDLRFDIIVVNIIKAVIVPIIGDLNERLNLGGVIILSGLLDQDREDIETALKAAGLNSFEIRHDNKWVTYRIDKK